MKNLNWNWNVRNGNESHCREVLNRAAVAGLVRVLADFQGNVNWNREIIKCSFTVFSLNSEIIIDIRQMNRIRYFVLKIGK